MHEGHDMGEDGLQRRFLLLPGLRSSRIHVFDTQPDPRSPRLHKTVEAAELAERAGYSRPHTLHCGPDGVFLTCLGGADGNDGPGGIALLDHSTFDVLRAWETDRGPQYLAYDAWWHLNQNVLVSSEWGTPSMIEDGLVPELLLGQKYGHSVHFWDLAEGRNLQTVDLGAEHQMVLELRPSHDPEATWGFVGVVVSTADLSASVWRWHREGTEWKVDKVITIPAEPADAADLPPALQPFGAVPPLISDIDLSVDDRMLYVSCWGTGELKQFDVSDPAAPREVGSVHLGGIVRRTAHPAEPSERLAGGPQMVEVSRDGRRVYVTNSLYGAWDDQFFPDGVGAWMAKIDTDPSTGGLTHRRALLPARRGLPRTATASGAPAGRGRLLGLVLLPLITPARPRLPVGRSSLTAAALRDPAGQARAQRRAAARECHVRDASRAVEALDVDRYRFRSSHSTSTLDTCSGWSVIST